MQFAGKVVLVTGRSRGSAARWHWNLLLLVPNGTGRIRSNAGWSACAHDSGRLHGSSDLRQDRWSASTPSARQSLSPRRGKSAYKWATWCRRASPSLAGSSGLRAPCLTQHPRLALAARSHRPARIAPTDRRLMDTPPEAATAGNRMLERWAFPCRTKRSELRSSPDPSVGSALKVRGTTALPPTYASGSWTGGTAAATRSVPLLCRAQDW